MNFPETFSIAPLDFNAMQRAKERWHNIAIPLDSLGKLQDIIVQCAGIFADDCVDLHKKATLVLCADNGIVAQGISQSGQEITRIVAENMTCDKATIALLNAQHGAKVFVVDIGMATDSENPAILRKKSMRGTNDFSQQNSMSRAEAQQAIETGISLVKMLKEDGYRLIATGEMGIGNTTTSSAVLAVLLNKPAAEVTGRGAGLSSAALQHKIALIDAAIAQHQPSASDMLDLLSKVGGLDIAGLAGVFLGGAIYRVPVVMDGFISCTAALVASKINPAVKDYLFASHVSAEPAGQMVLDALGLEAMLHLNMRLGEGSGAAMAFPIFETANMIYHQMSDFKEIQIAPYQPLA
ncbi:MAG: nicotinate-nucleotide--dimethylbenzimidazole phosphoribosyltransferase [Faecalibacterium sp.]